MSQADEFCQKLLKHAQIKADLYDGMNTRTTPDFAIRYIAEEFGEITSALTRGRIALSRTECIDLAHCAFLLWQSLENCEEGITPE